MGIPSRRGPRPKRRLLGRRMGKWPNYYPFGNRGSLTNGFTGETSIRISGWSETPDPFIMSENGKLFLFGNFGPYTKGPYRGNGHLDIEMIRNVSGVYYVAAWKVTIRFNPMCHLIRVFTGEKGPLNFKTLWGINVVYYVVDCPNRYSPKIFFGSFTNGGVPRRNAPLNFSTMRNCRAVYYGPRLPN